MDNNRILQTALQQSAYDCSCMSEDFLKRENVVVKSLGSEKARRYLELPHICNLVSYGNNIVACAREDLLEDIRQYVEETPHIEECFETPRLYHFNERMAKAGAEACFMAAYFLPDVEQVLGFDRKCGYELRVLEQGDLAELYLPEWSNALCRDRRSLDVLGVGAYDHGRLVGLAGCSADCDTMWQIGIDVLPEYRRQGIASALTNRIAREAFERDKIPFYCAAWSNVRSVGNAVRSGFRPGWVELTAKPADFVAKLLKKDEEKKESVRCIL